MWTISVMGLHRPHPKSRRLAERMAAQVGADIETSRAALAASIADVALRAGVAPSTVNRVLIGDAGVHLDTICAVGAAVGLRISVKTYPAEQPSLRDSGQLRVAEYLIGQAHPSLTPALEPPSVMHSGVRLISSSSARRKSSTTKLSVGCLTSSPRTGAANLKRESLQAQHSRPVRLVLAIEDTQRNRALVAPHQQTIQTALPATSSEILRALRTGIPLGRDGLLWVRPWRTASSSALDPTSPRR
jgi:hypothetical protein